jgi:NarL family two-component system response regulator YdfI
MIDVVIMAPVRARREWFQTTLSPSNLRIVGVAPSFPFLRSLLDELPAEVAIIDSDSTAEPEFIREWVLQILELLPVVLLAAAPDAILLDAFMRAERGALLRTDAPADQLIQAVQTAHSGLLALDASLIRKPETAGSLLEDLTPRETEVLGLLAEGLANREIAQRLNISEHTIKFHIRSILGKLGVSSRTEAVTQGFRHGLIEL